MSKRIVIIGAGVIGLCSAYYAQRRGHRVTIIDRGGPQRDGCSFGNAGMIVPSHFIPLAAPGMIATGLRCMGNPESPFYIKPRWSWDLVRWGMRFWSAANQGHVDRAAPLLRDLHLASRAEFEELAATTGNSFGLQKHGLLMLCKTARAMEHETALAAHATRLGVRADVLTPVQVAELDPAIRMEIAGGVHFPMDCHLMPGRFMAALQESLERGGADFRWDTEATGWKKSGDRLHAVQTRCHAERADEIEADEFVLCGGVWSESLSGELGLKLPMQAGKGYSLTLRKPRQISKICAILVEARVAVTPMGSAMRFGGTMELTGIDESVSARRVRGIIKTIPSYYPEFRADDFESVEPWVGLRPCSPDGMPYLGRTAGFSNLVIAAGHAMMGLSLGPITGKLVADLLDRNPPGIDLRLLDPDRHN